MAADRASTDSLCGPLVSSVLAFVARRRRVARGTLFRGRPGKCATARHRRPFDPPRQLSNRMYEEAARLAERERSVTNVICAPSVQRFTRSARERNMGIATMEVLSEVAGHLMRREASALVVDRHRSIIEVDCDREFEFLGQEDLALSLLPSDSCADNWSPRLKI